jgi:hypothetical protein
MFEEYRMSGRRGRGNPFIHNGFSTDTVIGSNLGAAPQVDRLDGATRRVHPVHFG